jgi:hypothetical protein
MPSNTDYDAAYYRAKYKEPAKAAGLTVRAFKAKLREGKCHTGHAEEHIQANAGAADSGAR